MALLIDGVFGAALLTLYHLWVVFDLPWAKGIG